MLKEVSSFFNELHGCDISQFVIKKATQKIPNADLRVVNIEVLPYPDDMFDCITALDVLEHAHSFEKSFANARVGLGREKVEGILKMEYREETRLDEAIRLAINGLLNLLRRETSRPE